MASEEMFSAGDECVSDSHLSLRRVLQSFVDTARAYLPLSPNQILYYGRLGLVSIGGHTKSMRGRCFNLAPIFAGGMTLSLKINVLPKGNSCPS